MKIKKHEIESVDVSQIENLNNSGGSSDIIPINTLAELNAVSANKTISIKSNIDLLSSTVTLPINVTIVFDGGIISNGELQGNNTLVIHDKLSQIFGIDTTFSGTYEFTEILPEWFGGGVGVENRHAFNKCMELTELNNGGTIKVNGNGYYDFSSVPDNGYWEAGDNVIGAMVYFSSNTDLIISDASTLRVVDAGEDVILVGTVEAVSGNVIEFQSINQPTPQPNDLDGQFYIGDTYVGELISKSGVFMTMDNLAVTPVNGDVIHRKRAAVYRLFGFNGVQNCSVKGGHIEGNKPLVGEADQPSCFRIRGLCKHILVEGVEVSEFPADFMNFGIINNYEGGISNVWEEGGIDRTTGLDIVDTNTYRTSSTQAVTARALEMGKMMAITNSSYPSNAGLWDARISVFVFDSNDVMLNAVTDIYMYDYFDIHPNASYTRMMVYNKSLNFDIERLEVRPFEVPTNIIVRNCDIHHNGRQCFSLTGVQDILIENNLGYETTGSPGYFVDLEDAVAVNKKIKIIGNKVWNNVGDIIMFGGNDILIEKNMFMTTSKNYSYDRNPGIHIQNEHHGVIVKDNTIQSKSMLISPNTKFINNTIKACYIGMVGGTFSDNIVSDSFLDVSKYTRIRDEYNSFILIKDNIFRNSAKFKDFVSLDKTINISADITNAEYDFVKLENNTIIGGDRINSIVVLSTFAEVDGLKLIDVHNTQFWNPKLKNITGNTRVTVWLNDNSDYIFENINLYNNDLYMRGIGLNSEILIKNLQVVLDNTLSSKKAFLTLNNTLSAKSLTIIDSYITDTSGLGITPITLVQNADGVFSDNIDKVTFKNNIVKTDVTSNLFNLTPVGNESHVIENNICNNITLNARTTDKLKNNSLDGRIKTISPIYADNASALVDLEVGEEYITASGEVRRVV